jgi:hypothetical protein
MASPAASKLAFRCGLDHDASKQYKQADTPEHIYACVGTMLSFNH